MILLIFILLIENIFGQGLKQIYPDYKKHVCKRTCDGIKKTCEYTLFIDTFYTMQPDCLNCTKGNDDHCDNPQCVPADGKERSIQTVNGMLPGPAIIVCHNDIIIANVVNRLSSETATIHWHGIHQSKSPFMDGVPMVTQCPINPQNNFTYTFIASEVGTHFYHSHSGFQRGNGLYGPLIVHENRKRSPKRDLFDFDLSEHIMFIMEWYTKSPDDGFFFYERNKKSAYSLIDGLMINGRVSSPNNTVPPKKFFVKKDKKYLFRVVHPGALIRPIEISIDSHQLTVISSDGSDIEPLTVDRLTITNGERYDYVLHANQPENQYAIRLNSSFNVSATGLGILAYEGSSNKTFTFLNYTRHGKNLNCINTKYNSDCYQYDNLTSVETSEEIKGKPDFTFSFVIDFSNDTQSRFLGLNSNSLRSPFINNIQYTPAASPLLTHPEASEKNWCNADNRKNCTVVKLCRCLHLVQVGRNKLVEFTLIDKGISLKDAAHPFHLHGYRFKVIGQNKIGDTVTLDKVKDLDQNNALPRNFDKPIIKDTVVIPSGGYVIIRFITDNPGYWLFHCHVDLHSEDGMELVLLVGDKRESIRRTPKKFPTCGNF